MKTLRDYQYDALGRTKFALARHKSAVMVLATGLGKTVCFSRLANDWERGNVLILAHRIELVDQAAGAIAAEIGYDPIIEQGERGGDPELLHEGGQVVVASIQTMITDRRRKKFRKYPFGLIIIDECHRATGASYQRLLDWCWELDPDCRVLGVTATPNRTDGTALGIVFESEAYQMGIVPGIDQGWLVDVEQKFAILDDVDFSKISVKRNSFGEVDFKPEDLEAVLSEEKVLHEMTVPVLDLTKDGKQGIIFAASVGHAHLWSMVLNRYRPGCAAAVDGHTDKEVRKELVKKFRSNELQFLLNFDCFSEGFDAPATSLVVMGRPTKSLLKYTQFLGRGTRPLPGCVDGIDTPEGRRDAIAASAKTHLTVIDFVGNSSHKIVSATDVLGGNYDVEVRDLAAARLKKKAGNVREEVRKAKAAMALVLEEKRRSEIKGEVKYQLQPVSPFAGDAPGVGVVQEKRGSLSDAQMGLLVSLGVNRETAIKYSRRQAHAVIDSMASKKCTDRQANVLKRAGYDPSKFNMDKASEKITELKGNNWQRTD